MKVKELIEKLRALSPEADVTMEYHVDTIDDGGETHWGYDEEVAVVSVSDLGTRVVLSAF